MSDIDWSVSNILFIANNQHEEMDNVPEKEIRSVVEPWLSAIFQSEHLSLLIGTGLTTAVCGLAECQAQAMQRLEFENFTEMIIKYSNKEAIKLARGTANYEDDLRSAIDLLKGLKILGSTDAEKLESEINSKLVHLIRQLALNEANLLNSDKFAEVFTLLRRFIISYASRTATRDRLHIFTTNYDRLIEYALDSAGIYTLDRFVGKLDPIMRMHKLELDYHYNPPGIRGEPRYVEGVVRYTKLHGSLDWKFQDDCIHKVPIPFGDVETLAKIETPFETSVIYPNSSKGIDTSYFPYSELFRDFSTAICRPNSVLVTYGYGFGDSHINNIIHDMMKILSTHIVIISFDQASGRIEKFVKRCNQSQITLIIGDRLGELKKLTENYLPKSAIDRISIKKHEILERRGEPKSSSADSIESTSAITRTGASSE